MDLPVIENDNFFFGVVAGVGNMEGLSPREKVLQVERDLIKHFPLVDLKEWPLNHVFHHGQCVRQLFIPQGSILTGRVHKFGNIVFVNSGDISFFTEFGFVRAQAGWMAVSEPGIKRCCFAHEDTLVTTVHILQPMDCDEVEKHLTVETFEEFENFIKEGAL